VTFRGTPITSPPGQRFFHARRGSELGKSKPIGGATGHSRLLTGRYFDRLTRSPGSAFVAEEQPEQRGFTGAAGTGEENEFPCRLSRDVGRAESGG
jgi:hypothetical protein